MAGAKRHRLEPWAYLRDVLLRLSAGETDQEALLPDRWAATHPEHVLEHRLEESRRKCGTPEGCPRATARKQIAKGLSIREAATGETRWPLGYDSAGMRPAPRGWDGRALTRARRPPPDRPLGLRPGSRPDPFPRGRLRAPFRQARGLRCPEGAPSSRAILEDDGGRHPALTGFRRSRAVVLESFLFFLDLAPQFWSTRLISCRSRGYPGGGRSSSGRPRLRSPCHGSEALEA